MLADQKAADGPAGRSLAPRPGFLHRLLLRLDAERAHGLALTGLRARVGNYPGVTVERREGDARVEGLDGRRIRVIDLPGTYSLAPISPDEAVVSRVLAGELPGVPAPDALLIIADACSLERSLLLVAQALRLDKPACLVLTMIDELHARGGELDPLQASFADLGGTQCGYCTPGILVTAHALFRRVPTPSRKQIREALSGCLCRCTGYQQIFESVEEAMVRMQPPPSGLEEAGS